MIYTLTLNPSLDYVMDVANFTRNEICRSQHESYYPGGKGINVSQVLHTLGSETTALGFIAGFSGTYLKDLLEMKGIEHDLIELACGTTRINVKIRSQHETAINATGPSIDEASLAALYTQLDELTSSDMLVFAGNLPPSVNTDVQHEILKRCQHSGARLIVDMTGKALLDSLAYKPFLIKPNREELEDVFGERIGIDNDLDIYTEKLRHRGAQNVLVSLGGDGAFLHAADDHIYQMSAPKGTVKNTVGAGDSMVAGFLHAIKCGASYEKALIFALATGSATAFSDGLANLQTIDSVLQDMTKQ